LIDCSNPILSKGWRMDLPNNFRGIGCFWNWKKSISANFRIVKLWFLKFLGKTGRFLTISIYAPNIAGGQVKWDLGAEGAAKIKFFFHCILDFQFHICEQRELK